MSYEARQRGRGVGERGVIRASLGFTTAIFPSLLRADVSKISSRLVSESKQFKWGAKKLNLMDAWKQYAPMVIAALIFLFVIWWRFF